MYGILLQPIGRMREGGTGGAAGRRPGDYCRGDGVVWSGPTLSLSHELNRADHPERAATIVVRVIDPVDDRDRIEIEGPASGSSTYGVFQGNTESGIWQGSSDSNRGPSVLETDALTN